MKHVKPEHHIIKNGHISKCQVCNSDNNSYSTALKYWDDSRNVTGINK